MIYIFSPANQVSGGPEALQQMCYYLRSIGKESVIVFYNYDASRDPMPQRYKIYGNEWILVDKVQDKPENAVIVPERRPFYLNPYKNAKRYIWWLSKDNFIFEKAPLAKRIKYGIKKFLHIDVIPLDTRYCNFNLNDCTHLCGSKYAYEYVKKGLGLDCVYYCVEPISLDFLNLGAYDGVENRKDIVLYNPSKPSALMQKLLERGKFNYLPLKGYSPSGLAELYKTSKLYVDFGAFPGPERIPKEMVYFGGQIIVGYQNAAKNDFDVAIPDKYKVKDLENVEAVESMINEMLDNFNFYNQDFYSFKLKIERLEEDFVRQIRTLF